MYWYILIISICFRKTRIIRSKSDELEDMNLIIFVERKQILIIFLLVIVTFYHSFDFPILSILGVHHEFYSRNALFILNLIYTFSLKSETINNLSILLVVILEMVSSKKWPWMQYPSLRINSSLQNNPHLYRKPTKGFPQNLAYILRRVGRIFWQKKFAGEWPPFLKWPPTKSAKFQCYLISMNIYSRFPI
jgi:hypothetical protein